MLSKLQGLENGLPEGFGDYITKALERSTVYALI